jgi:hypothetical protein
MALFGAGGDQSLNITIKAKDDATAALNKVRLSISDIAKGSAIGELAVRGLTTAFHFLEGIATASIREFEQYNQAVAQTNTVLTSTQHAAGLTANEVIKLSKSISENTLYQDDAVLAAENLLLTFTNISKDTFPRATQAVLDVSTALGQDLSSSAIQVGKALNSPIDGLAMLSRVGIQFTNSQTEMITTLVKSGRTLEAQNLILDELNKKFAGSAKSAYEASSSLTKLQKNVVELEQDIGAGLVPAMNNLYDSFVDAKGAGGSYNDTAFTTFHITSQLAQMTLAAAIGFAAIGTAITNVGTRLEQLGLKYSGASWLLNKFGIDTDRALSSFRDNTNEGLLSAVNFYDTLADRNEKVEMSWGQLNVDATKFGKAGPAAYQATAAEAAKANEQIKKTQQTIADTKKTLDSYRKDLQGETSSVAQAFVDQEQKLKDIQQQLKDAEAKPVNQRDAGQIADLKTQLNKEGTAYANSRYIESQLPTQVADARRRAGETDFERNLEDISKRIADKEQSFAGDIVYNIQFNDAVAGDDGIRKIITTVLSEINRGAALKQLAGT